MVAMRSLASPETAPQQGESVSGAMTAHIASASGLGAEISGLVIWLVETFGHIKVPEVAEVQISGICIFIASYLLRKFGG